MYLSKATSLKQMLLNGKTIPAGIEIYPVEGLINHRLELERGNISKPEPVTADGNLWAADPKDIASFFSGASFELVKPLSNLLLKMEYENPSSFTILSESSGRVEMINAIKLETLKRRTKTYHKEN